MSDSPASDSTPQNISQADIELLNKLNNNPIVGTQIRMLLTRFEQEVAAGMDAHEAEEMAIAQLQDLGKALMGQWAESTHEKAPTNANGAIVTGKKSESAPCMIRPRRRHDME